VPGHHVRAKTQLAAFFGVLRGAREDLDLIRDVIPHDPPDHWQQPGIGLGYRPALSRKNESPHTYRVPTNLVRLTAHRPDPGVGTVILPQFNNF
jgi:hypothetical protein